MDESNGDKMSEDNMGNRNSIKPLPAKNMINDPSRKKIGAEKSKVRGKKETIIEPANNININVFGKECDKTIIKKRSVDNKDRNYFGIKK